MTARKVTKRVTTPKITPTTVITTPTTPAAKVRPTLAEMKAKLAMIDPSQEVYEGETTIGETLGTGVAKAVSAVGDVGAGVSEFFSAFGTSYSYHRAVATGKIAE